MSDIILTGVEWLGAVLAVSGSLLLSLNNEYSRWGWVLYLLSNVALISFAVEKGLSGILAMQTVFLVTTLLGIRRWFFPSVSIHSQDRLLESSSWRKS